MIYPACRNCGNRGVILRFTDAGFLYQVWRDWGRRGVILRFTGAGFFIPGLARLG